MEGGKEGGNLGRLEYSVRFMMFCFFFFFDTHVQSRMMVRARCASIKRNYQKMTFEVGDCLGLVLVSHYVDDAAAAAAAAAADVDYDVPHHVPEEQTAAL